MVSYLLSVQMRIGVPYWDVYNYLNNAIIFAGMGGENSNTINYLSPLLPFNFWHLEWDLFLLIQFFIISDIFYDRGNGTLFPF